MHKDLIQNEISNNLKLPINAIDRETKNEEGMTYYLHYFSFTTGDYIQGTVDKFIETPCFAIKWHEKEIIYNLNEL